MSPAVRLLITEHSSACAAARRALCSAWAVAAVPLLLSQVHPQPNLHPTCNTR
jgi:hypothetical protein